jgi:hemerythrin
MEQMHRSLELVHGISEAAQLHPTFFAALDQLPSMSDGEFVIQFDLFVSNLEGDLRAEEQWMEEIAFPGLKEHRALHAEVLGVLHKGQARAMAGDLTLARRAVELLPEWLADHTSTMDVPLAAALRVAASRKQQPNSMLSAA